MTIPPAERILGIRYERRTNGCSTSNVRGRVSRLAGWSVGKMRFHRGDAFRWRRADSRSPRAPESIFEPERLSFSCSTATRLSSGVCLREIRSPLESRCEKRFNFCRGRRSAPRALPATCNFVSRFSEKIGLPSAVLGASLVGKISARD